MPLLDSSARRRLFVVVALLVAPVTSRSVLAQETAPAAHGTLEIVTGTWRVANQPDVDVTAALQGMVKDGEISTRLNAAALGLSAPGKGRVGSLTITYKINGGDPLSKTVRGGGTQLSLSAPPPESAPAVEAPAADVVQLLKGHTDGVISLAFSPDSKILASGSADQSIIFWDVAAAKQSRQIQADAAVYAVAFSPDGKYFAWGTADHTIGTYNLAQEKSGDVHVQRCPVVALAFLPDSKHFVSCCGENLRVWDLQKRENIGVYDADAQLYSLVVSKTGKVVTIDLDANLVEWDPLTGAKIAHHERPKASTAKGDVTNYPTGLAAAPDDHVLVSDVTGVWDWDLAGDKITLVAKEIYQVAAASADGKLYFGHNAGDSIWIREAGPTGSLRMPKVSVQMNSMALSPDGNLLAMSAGSCWDLINRRAPLKPPFDISLQAVAPLAAQLAAEKTRDESGRVRAARGQLRPGSAAVEADDPSLIVWQ